MKIATIIGARPQFIKAAAVSRAIAAHNRQALNLDPGTSNIELRTLNFEHSSSVEPRTLNIEHSTLNEFLIHTGQHYDDGMSAVFFRELEIPEPKYNLAIGSGSHGAQTGQMLAAIEKILIDEKPDWVLIYGDTNSTLAGALAAAKLHIPIAHVEAGLRSFNRRMPEEINRIVADQLSTLLLCPSQVAVDNLAAEGIGGNPMVRQAHHDKQGCHPEPSLSEPPPALRAASAGGGQKESSPVNLEQSSNIEHRTLNLEHSSPVEHRTLNIEQSSSVVITGDVMADALQFAATKASAQSDILARLGLQPQRYLLATVHRAENTDDPKRLSDIMAALSELAEREPVILPLHPRTKKILERTSNRQTSNIEHRTLNIEHSSSVEPRTLNFEHPCLRLIDPLGYFDIIALEKSARMLLTDSGGMQKEAYWLKVPCVTLRDETEWVETVASGWNILTGADRNRIVTAVQNFTPPKDHPPLYGGGQAAEKILSILCQNL
jgi:UDP-GlcNAc3NAcA epimerase